MIAFLIAGLVGVWWCNKLYYPKTLFPQGSASAEGQNIDTMLWITIAVTGRSIFHNTNIIILVLIQIPGK